ncbi:hypothetical protein BDW22DRAFT_554889 [Trametopsis cervina]|nr:hypothetical protein BDW22DRAFT_554889 [Trametopsis cervina]
MFGLPALTSCTCSHETRKWTAINCWSFDEVRSRRWYKSLTGKSPTILAICRNMDGGYVSNRLSGSTHAFRVVVSTALALRMPSHAKSLNIFRKFRKSFVIFPLATIVSSRVRVSNANNRGRGRGSVGFVAQRAPTLGLIARRWMFFRLGRASRTLARIFNVTRNSIHGGRRFSGLRLTWRERMQLAKPLLRSSWMKVTNLESLSGPTTTMEEKR